MLSYTGIRIISLSSLVAYYLNHSFIYSLIHFRQDCFFVFADTVWFNAMYMRICCTKYFDSWQIKGRISNMATVSSAGT